MSVPSLYVIIIPPFTSSVLIPLPLDQTSDGDECFTVAITADLPGRPTKLVCAIIISMGETLIIGEFKNDKARFCVSPDTRILYAKYRDWVRSIEFELLTPKVKRAFVGIKLNTLL